MILCLETSGRFSSVALSNGSHYSAETENFQAEHILSLIDTLLKEAGITGEALDALAVSVGPGRFTGLRVGIAVAQGLAFAWHKKVLAIDSLAILAQGVYRRYGAEKVRVAMDARREEVYRESFLWDGKIMVSQQDLSIMSIKEREIDSEEWVGAGSGFLEYPGLAKGFKTCYISAPDRTPYAEDMISLAIKAYQDRKAIEPARILPNYLREEVVS